MTTLEDRLRDLGRTVTPPPLPGASVVMHRARQRRRRRRGQLAAAVVLTAGTGSALAGRAILSEDDPTLRTSAATPSDDGSGAVERPGPTTPPCTPPATAADDMTVVIPDVLALTVAEGRRTMEEVGLMVEVVGEVADDALVTAQAPAAGTEVQPGSLIRLEGGQPTGP